MTIKLIPVETHSARIRREALDYKTVTRYAVTHLDKDGQRTLATANQRHHFFDTKAEATQHKWDMLANNSQDTLNSLFGFPLEVRPVECIIMKDGREGDATSVWFD